jgi:hypothetical protein
MTDKDKRLKSAINSALRVRNYRRVRDRALAKLSQAYPQTYKELLEQERIVDEQMGKKWLDLDGSASYSMDINTDTPPSGGGEGYQASSSADQGNDGGKA